MKRFRGVSDRARREADLFLADLTGVPLVRPAALPAPVAEDSEDSSQGEIVLLEEEGEPEGLVLPSDDAEDEAAPVPFDAGIPMLGRILWPALGFPAVVVPGANPRREPTRDVDATRCLTLLVLTNRPTLSPEEAARSLRIVPWSQRGRRYIPDGEPGAFKATGPVTGSAAP